MFIPQCCDVRTHGNIRSSVVKLVCSCRTSFHPILNSKIICKMKFIWKFTFFRYVHVCVCVHIQCVRIILVSVFPLSLFFKAVLILVYLQCLLLSEYRRRGDVGNAVRLWEWRWGVRKRETVDRSIPSGWKVTGKWERVYSTVSRTHMHYLVL
jgi:hypothetical protein